MCSDRDINPNPNWHLPITKEQRFLTIAHSTAFNVSTNSLLFSFNRPMPSMFSYRPTMSLGLPRASYVKERSWIDPDFRERSLTKRFVPARALSFFGIQKNLDPGSFSHATHVFVCKQTVISFGAFKVFFLSFFLILFLTFYSLTVYK